MKSDGSSLREESGSSTSGGKTCGVQHNRALCSEFSFNVRDSSESIGGGVVADAEVVMPVAEATAGAGAGSICCCDTGQVFLPLLVDVLCDIVFA